MSPSKKAVNLSVDAALLREARERDINLSATLERALADVLRQDRRARRDSDGPRLSRRETIDNPDAHAGLHR